MSLGEEGAISGQERKQCQILDLNCCRLCVAVDAVRKLGKGFTHVDQR